MKLSSICSFLVYGLCIITICSNFVVSDEKNEKADLVSWLRKYYKEDASENCFLTIHALYLKDMDIIEMPCNMKYLENLKILCIYNDEKKDYLTNFEIPSVIFSLTSLERLAISNYRLITISEKISNLSNLQMLDLSGNNFSTLPDNLISLANLKMLDLSGCDFSTLPQVLIDIVKSKQNISIFLHKNTHDLKNEIRKLPRDAIRKIRHSVKP